MDKVSLVEQYEEISEFCDNCRFKCIYDTLYLNHMPIEMYKIILLSTENYINTFVIQNINKLNLLGMSTFSPLFDIELLRKLGFSYQELAQKQTDSLHKIHQYTLENKIVVMYFDSAKLMDKYTVKMINFNMLTSGIILNVNAKENQIILNSLGSKKDKYISVDFDKFQIARNSNIYPISPNYKAFYIYKRNNIEIKNIDRIVNNHLKQLAKNFFKGGEVKINNQIKLKQGIDAYEEVINFFDKLKRQLEETNKVEKKVIDSLFVIIANVLRRTLICSSSTFNREEFGKALEEYGKEIASDILIKIAKDIIKISKIWRNIVRNLYRANKYLNKKSDFIDMIISEISTIKQLEIEAMKGFESFDL